ncbi:cytochrome C oxidase subunit IV family protein [Emticicia sp. BO119]|uniref:cytochrome C oxidase subunit IV family protein n=1 Tax=Emticicia sp. BO119 TaxID=2757768 RepID=UPI0015EFE31F|nr:cytochrome C oxidase subunit IV family protein [Emticicia sp. BO119]MBA4850681.1 cytochrome C oxidase subunit IV family protein [Emticicia sp. BO119]
MAQHTEHHGHEEKLPAQTKEIWRTFWILLIITSFEFVIAFTIDADHYKWTKIGIFVILTIVKAYYIVGIFMHLKHEVKSLIWTIILPCVFVVWLVVALIIEGGYIGFERFFFGK